MAVITETTPRPSHDPSEPKDSSSREVLAAELEAIEAQANTMAAASTADFDAAAHAEILDLEIPAKAEASGDVADLPISTEAVSSKSIPEPIISTPKLKAYSPSESAPVVVAPPATPVVEVVGKEGSPGRPPALNDEGERIELTVADSEHDPTHVGERSDKEIRERYGMTREEYDARIAGDREKMLGHEIGSLGVERKRINEYLDYLKGELAGEEIPPEMTDDIARMEARVHDLNFALDNKADFRDSKTGDKVDENGKSTKRWKVPELVTEKIKVVIPKKKEPKPPVPPPPPGPPAPPPPPGPPGPPPGPPAAREPIVARIADTESTDRRMARVLADHRLNTELADLRQELYGANENEGGNRFSRMVKAVARGVKGTVLHPIKSMEYVAKSTMLREGYRQKYIHKQFGDMEGANFHSAVAQEVARRLDLGEDLLLDGEQILAEDNPEVRAVKEQLNRVFHQGIAGSMDRASVIEEAKRIAESASWIQKDGDQGPHLVQNLEVIYDRIVAQVDHEAGLAAVDEAFRLEGGIAKLDVNAEAHKTKVDGIMEKLTNSKFKGILVNEATTAVAVGAVASFVGNFFKSSGVRKGAMLLGFAGAGFSLPVALAAGAAAGGFALLRERMTLRQERALHMSDIAQGKEMPDSPEYARRRAEIDATLVQMTSSEDLLQRFDELQPEDGLAMSPGDAQELANWLTSITTLQELGDQRSMDLISYSSPDNVEGEKTDLFVARAQATAMIQDYAAAHPDFMDGVPGSTVNEKIAYQVQIAQREILEGAGGVSDKDKVFRGLMRKRGAQRAVATAAFSVFASFLSSKVTDQIGGGEKGETITHRSVEDNVHTPVTFKGDAMNMPKGWHTDGKSLFDAKGDVVVQDFKGAPVGHGLSAETLAEFKAKGIKVHETVDWKENVTTRNVSVPEYMRERPGEFKLMHRTGWMDNNTPSPRFDLNELRLDFKANPDGSITLASDRMYNGGSFHDQLAIMAHSEQSGGNLRMLITPSREDQAHAITLDIQPNGTVVLPQGSAAREFFDIAPDGKVDFKGGFVEVGYPSTVRPDGSQGYYILATSPGSNQPIDITIVDKVRYPVTTATLVVPKVDTEVIPDTLWKAPFIPIAAPLPRRPLEKLRPVAEIIKPPSYYYGESNLESAKRWLDGREHMHRPYRQVVVGEGENRREIWVDKDGKEVDRDVEREKDTIDTYLAEIQAADPTYYDYLVSLGELGTMPDMDENCRVSVNIPAWMEGKTIYRLLSQYTQQTNPDGTPIDPSLFEINIIINRKTGAASDESVAEIERFLADMRTDGKDFRINYLDVEFDPPLNNVGHARKVITDLTMLRSRKRPSQSGSLYIESEDADLLTVDPRVITNVITSFDAKPHVDVLRGNRNDRMPGLMMENDVLFASRRMWDFTERLLRRKKFRPENSPNPEKWSYQWNRIYSNGWGTAYTAEAYAMIGGYDSRQTKGEDMLVGERITMLRGDGEYPNTEVVDTVNNRTSSSPRRFVQEVITGQPSYGDSFDDPEVNDIIRNTSLGEMIGRLSPYDRLSKPEAQAKMFGITAGYWEFIKDNTPNQMEAELVFGRLMTFMGFKKGDYEHTPGGGVKISNYTNLADALQRYRDNPPEKVSEEYDLIREDVESGAL